MKIKTDHKKRGQDIKKLSKDIKQSDIKIFDFVPY